MNEIVPASSTALARRELTVEVFQLASMIAPSMHACRYFGVSTPEQALAIMLTGYSYGFDLVASFRNIYVIENKPSLAPAAAWGIVLSSGLLEDYEIRDTPDDKGRPFACTVTLKRKGLAKSYSVTYTLDDAREAYLTEGSPTKDGKRGRGNWEKYPANMLRWRAVGYACDALFADLMAGSKRADEFGATINAQGEIVADGASYTDPEIVEGVVS